MQADRWKRAQELYEAAAALVPEERAEYLERACPNDASLRAEVESLLAQPAGTFLESSPVSAIKTLAAGARLGNFEIVELIGRGGMGEVYRARDTRLKRDVAIKVLPAGRARDPDRIARFEREARAAGALNHPNIVAVHETGREGDIYWIAAELVRGESLAGAMERGPMAVSRVIEVATQIADALAAAHAAGIVHRDLKPANVMVTRDGRVKVLDFGLALRRRTSQDSTTLDITDEGTVMGTAGYMSPEQVRGETVDPRSDLFSFGVIMHEMLGGKRAFTGGSSVEVMNAILKEEPGELPGTTPPPLDRIVRRCLQKDRERRFQAAADLRWALENSLAVAPLSERPQRRRWLGLAAVGICIVAASATLVLSERPLSVPRVVSIKQITSDDYGNTPPMLTDGARLLFNLSTDPRQISVKGGGPAPFTLPIQNAEPVDISPDHTELLLYRYHDSIGDESRYELWAAPLLGGASRRLGDLIATSEFGLHGDGRPDASGFPTPTRLGRARGALQSAAAWSPDGQYLIYPRGSELHLARSDGSEIRKLASVDGYPSFVRWSPDGRKVRLSVSSSGDRSSSLWELSVDDRRLRPLLPNWDPSWYTCCGNWTPDGKYYVFQSRSNIWIRNEKASLLPRGGSAPVQLTSGPMEAYWPVPSLDGKRIFFGGYQRRREFLRYQLGSGQFVPDLVGVSGTELEYSRDGKWVAYISMPDHSLMRAAADGSERLQLTWPPMTAAMPHWSPDGKQIAFIGMTDGKPARIYLSSASGGANHQITNGESGDDGDSDPSWSPDGSALAFGAWSSSARTAIHLLDLKTNRVTALAGSEGMWSPRWSPDGRYIAGLSAGERKLILYDMQTRTQSRVSELHSNYPSWGAEGDSLFFTAERWWWRYRMVDKKVERINVLDIVGGPELIGLRMADWGWFAAASKNSLLTVSDAGTFEIYAIDLEGAH